MERSGTTLQSPSNSRVLKCGTQTEASIRARSAFRRVASNANGNFKTVSIPPHRTGRNQRSGEANRRKFGNAAKVFPAPYHRAMAAAYCSLEVDGIHVPEDPRSSGPP